MSKPVRILLAEDTPELNEMYSQKLKKHFRVDSVLTVREAKEKLDKTDYTLVVLDWEFQGETETGVDLAKYIRRTKGKRVKLLLLSTCRKSMLLDLELRHLKLRLIQILGRCL